ncbi:MAG: glycosyl transferase family 2 [Armatimonadetes bacterium CP1_7O]|nr:MAG: glycosyl transferase family 2 [Armatimonadetes bacterium CP1_7O]RMH07675.1 MAG: glycosyltransferase [Armatimonadota bacterium]
MKVAAIVPAYNEATRIERVLGVLIQCPPLHEIIVVNDGSLDDTATVALQFAQQHPIPNTPSVRVINLPVNRGKGGAMFAGATATDADVIIFFDADLIGLKPEHVERILKPVLEGEAAMSIGVFRGGRLSTDMAQILVPYISGQRALLRALFTEIPGIERTRSGVEIALTLHFRRHRYPVAMVTVEGVTHTMKEEKLGWARGVWARAKMYAEIGKAFLRYTRLSDLRHKLLLKREE